MNTRKPVTGPLLEYLNEHQNMTVTVGELVKAIDHNRNAIQKGMAGIASAHPERCEIVAAGNCWVWHSTTTEKTIGKGTVFEYLAETKSGTILVQSDDGTVYRLAELD